MNFSMVNNQSAIYIVGCAVVSLRPSPHHVREIWNHSFVSKIRLPVHTNLLWKWNFSKMFFRAEEDENASLMHYIVGNPKPGNWKLDSGTRNTNLKRWQIFVLKKVSLRIFCLASYFFTGKSDAKKFHEFEELVFLDLWIPVSGLWIPGFRVALLLWAENILKNGAF